MVLKLYIGNLLFYFFYYFLSSTFIYMVVKAHSGSLLVRRRDIAHHFSKALNPDDLLRLTDLASQRP